MSTRPDRSRAIFSEALAKPTTEERGHFLAAACGSDDELRRQVDALLRAHAEAGDFLGQNVLDHGPAVGEQPGDVIGRYKLLQQIGEGGFGVVFMAEQQDPVRRLVALKILKAGMDTKEVIARFEAERQALALMDHPNIAKVLDGGVTGGDKFEVRTAKPEGSLNSEESAPYVPPPAKSQLTNQKSGIPSGRPYFVMDLVKGVPITEFCEQHQLSVEARLRLFLQVCAGVQHAHQKGVIHRDLKPTNILVIHEPGQAGVPKVIDFGIAKAIGQKLTERTLFTRFEQLIGTPAYMSPEQAEWSGVDVDTRSDLYSLGVLLYELLTGTTPLEKETLARAAFDEMRRMIREVEPPKPSTRLTALVAADVRRRTASRGPGAEISGQRSEVSKRGRGQEAEADTGTPEQSASLRRRLQRVRGDLDWIVMKCLEKDRSRRYETVNGLAGDLKRHLQGEPVVARPPSRMYLTGKFVRKHRVAVVASSGVVLALVMGLAVSLVGLAAAQRERQRAQRRAEIATAISTFLQKDLLEAASPNNSADREVRLRTVLDRVAARIGSRLTNQPLTEAAIRGSLGETYRALGEYAVAEEHQCRAVELCRSNLPADDPFRRAQVHGLARVLQDEGRYAEVIELLRPLVYGSPRQPAPADLPSLGYLHTLGESYLHAGDYASAESVLREVLDKRRRLQGGNEVDTLSAMNDLAGVYRASARPTEAAAMLEQLLEVSRRQPGPDHPFTLTAQHNLARLRFELGDYARATPPLAALVETAQRVLGPQHDLTLQSEALLADVHACAGRWAECAELYRRVVATTNRFDLRVPDKLQWWAGCAEAGAVASLLAGDPNGYRDLSHRLLAAMIGTTNADCARIAAEACLLVPDPPENLEAACALADRAPQADRGLQTWNHLAKGLAEYRRGHLDEALRWLDPVRRGQRSSAASQAGYLCAMIRQRQGDAAAARAALDEAAARLAAFIRPGQPGVEWHEYGRVAAIRAEAERLILGREESPRVDPVWLETARQRWGPVRERLTEANRLASQRDWTAARDTYLAAMREPAFDWESAQDLEAVNAELNLGAKMGITFLLAGDRDSHEQLCRKLAAFLEQHPDSEAACRVVAVCLAQPLPATLDLGLQAIRALELIPFEPDEVGLARTMVAYRAGRYAEALNRRQPAENSQRVAIRSAAQLFQAMALVKLGRPEDARRELREAESRLAPFLANFTGDRWWDLGLCQLVLDEARPLCNDQPRQ